MNENQKKVTEEYKEGWERIFGKKDAPKEPMHWDMKSAKNAVKNKYHMMRDEE